LSSKVTASISTPVYPTSVSPGETKEQDVS
jgi:hypothetical protein